MENNDDPNDESLEEKKEFKRDSDFFGSFSWVGRVVPALAFFVIFPVTVTILFIGEIVVFGLLRPFESLTYGAVLGMFIIPIVVGAIISLVLGVALGLIASRKISDSSEEV